MAKSSGSVRNARAGGAARPNLATEYARYAEESLSQMDSYLTPVSKASRDLTNDETALMRDRVADVVRQIASVSTVGELRRAEQYIAEAQNEMHTAIVNRISLLENNRDFANGRAKATYDDAISNLRMIDYIQNRTLREITTSPAAIALEEDLIRNNRW